MANKKRLIDPHDLWTDIMMLPHNGDMISSEEVEQAIKDAPTVDAVEVVRCKDCEHKYLNKHGELCCEIWAHNRDTVVIDYDFCSYGRRKINV